MKVHPFFVTFGTVSTGVVSLPSKVLLPPKNYILELQFHSLSIENDFFDFAINKKMRQLEKKTTKNLGL